MADVCDHDPDYFYREDNGCAICDAEGFVEEIYEAFEAGYDKGVQDALEHFPSEEKRKEALEAFKEIRGESEQITGTSPVEALRKARDLSHKWADIFKNRPCPPSTMDSNIDAEHGCRVVAVAIQELIDAVS